MQIALYYFLSASPLRVSPQLSSSSPNSGLAHKGSHLWPLPNSLASALVAHLWTPLFPNRNLPETVLQFSTSVSLRMPRTTLRPYTPAPRWPTCVTLNIPMSQLLALPPVSAVTCTHVQPKVLTTLSIVKAGPVGLLHLVSPPFCTEPGTQKALSKWWINKCVLQFNFFPVSAFRQHLHLYLHKARRRVSSCLWQTVLRIWGVRIKAR